MLSKKKYGSHFVSFFILVSCLAACKKDTIYQKKSKPEITIGVDDSRLMSNVIHLYKDTVYVFAANIVRDAGQVLAIEAGTLVKVNDRISITINPGATIEALGKVDEPVIFTSSVYRGGVGVGSGAAGGERFWYGIRIYGDAVNQPSVGSGILSHVRIEFAGGNENYSGLPSLLLKDVTAATTIDNIQVSYSFETSSFEFNGGNVNAVNLVSYASSGSDFNINGGYTGMLQSLLAYRHPYFGAVSGERTLAGMIIKGSATNPAISNLTVLGPDLQKGTNESYNKSDETQFDKAEVSALITTGSARFHIRNSVFLGFPKGGFYLDDKETGISLNSGESDFTFSMVHSNDSSRAFYLPPDVYPPYTATDFKNFLLQPQFANKLLIGSEDFMLTDPFKYDVNPDPIPKTGSALLNGADFNSAIFDHTFFKKVGYRGALGSDNWMKGWTNFIPLQTNYNN